MTVRPNIEQETVELVNKKLRGTMRVDPEKVGLDEKIRVLVNELEELEQSAKEQQNVIDRIDQLDNRVQELYNEALRSSDGRP